METDKYENAVHIFLQRLNLGFVLALGFFSVKVPERVGATVKIAYHWPSVGLTVRTNVVGAIVNR